LDPLIDRLTADLGFAQGRISFHGNRVVAKPKLAPQERRRLQNWSRGLRDRNPLGVFVYDHWLDIKKPNLYQSPSATVRYTGGVWKASIKGLTVKGSTPLEAAQKLSQRVVEALELADIYVAVKPR